MYLSWSQAAPWLDTGRQPYMKNWTPFIKLELGNWQKHHLALTSSDPSGFSMLKKMQPEMLFATMLSCPRIFSGTWCQLFWHICPRCEASIDSICSGHSSSRKPGTPSDRYKGSIFEWRAHQPRGHLHAATPWLPCIKFTWPRLLTL